MKTITLQQYLEQTPIEDMLSILSPYIQAMASVAKYIRSRITHASIQGIYGTTGAINIQGEEVQHLDRIADDYCMQCLEECGIIAGVVSEERKVPVPFTSSSHTPYIAVIDPLDGSSNIETNNTIGTIFSLLRRTSPLDESICIEDFLQKGTSYLCAGYIAYGPATILVFTVGNGVHVFTYCENTKDFILIKESLKMPQQGYSYSTNEAYLYRTNHSTQEFIEKIKKDSSYSLRYVGSLVADIHRILWKGGIFIYPTQYINNSPQNKLRLLYECIPIAFLIEQAGGKATNGSVPIHTILPTHIHERSALYCGSQQEMDEWISICNNTSKI